jgi:hypothetical protein
MKKPSMGALLLVVTVSLVSPMAAHGAVASGFSQTPLEPATGEVVTFTSTASAPGKGNRLIALQWDLDNDGAFDDATGQTAARAFAPAGTYVVRLRAVDRTLNEAVTAQAVIVHNPPPTPLLSPFPVVQMAGRLAGRDPCAAERAGAGRCKRDREMSRPGMRASQADPHRKGVCGQVDCSPALSPLPAARAPRSGGSQGVDHQAGHDREVLALQDAAA